MLSEKKTEEAKKLLPQVYKFLDKAAKTGLIKKNTASRKKSRITNRRNSHMDVSNMNRFNHLVLFTLDEQRYALYLPAVTRVVRTVEITPLPKAPEAVRGVVNVQGQVIPVVDIRKRFRLPEREMELSDQGIIASTSRRPVALVVDTVEGVIEHSNQEIIPLEKILPSTEYIEGMVKLEDGLVLIHDLDKFLSLEEDKELNDVLKKRKGK